MAARSATFVLSDRQTALLASPARLEVIEALDALGRASARELATHLGRPPGAVYHHVRTLTQAGLFIEVGVRRGSRRPEVIYGLVAPRLAVAAGASRSGDRRALRTLQAVLRQAGRDVEAALDRGPALLKGRFYGGQVGSALTAGEVKRVLALTNEIEALLRRAKRKRSARVDDVYRWTSVFVPLGRKRS
jgi:DNA-binding transcriptional ArsR family regulator